MYVRPVIALTVANPTISKFTSTYIQRQRRLQRFLKVDENIFVFLCTRTRLLMVL
jgi:hypothetical protein